MSFRHHVLSASVCLTLLSAIFAGAAVANERMNMLDKYHSEAKKADKNFKSFSADAGRQFFNAKRKHSVKNEDRSCTTCHTTDPRAQGKTVVGKPIDPMAPSVNKERFTDPKKVEKWFKRNCEWVLERECNPKEKGDYITYMMSL